jgi:two-component system LytT family response regulator
MDHTESIEKPLKHVLSQLHEVSANSSISIEHLINKLAGLTMQQNQFVIKETGEIRFIDIDDIEWIKGAGSYPELYLFNCTNPVLYRCSLRELVERLEQRYVCSYSPLNHHSSQSDQPHDSY